VLTGRTDIWLGKMCGTHADLLLCFSEGESFINLRGAEHRFSAAGHPTSAT